MKITLTHSDCEALERILDELIVAQKHYVNHMREEMILEDLSRRIFPYIYSTRIERLANYFTELEKLHRDVTIEVPNGSN